MTLVMTRRRNKQLIVEACDAMREGSVQRTTVHVTVSTS